MNVLPIEKKVLILSALVEGNSIRSIERMTGVHRDTIMFRTILKNSNYYIPKQCTSRQLMAFKRGQ